jgi:transposase
MIPAGWRMCESGWMKSIEVRLGPGDREWLEAVIGSRNNPQKHVWRARIVLLSADGVGTMAIQRQTGKDKPTIWRWQTRFMAGGVEGSLHEATRPAGKPPLTPETIERVVEMTLAEPPEHALVLSVDEKSQIQALDRTQPGLPMKKGRSGTTTHDYKRHGTTTLSAALDVLDGKVIGQCMARHRHQEFICFLNKINRETPVGRELHLIIDNYATHKHPKVRTWLERHLRFHFHFTPTSASWLNAVEGFFAKLTRQRLKRGVSNGIVDLQAAINRYLAETKDNPKPFTWTADPDAIEKARRGKQVSEPIH